MRATIYIEGAPFTADEVVLERVEKALKKAGYLYDHITGGWEPDERR